MASRDDAWGIRLEGCAKQEDVWVNGVGEHGCRWISGEVLVTSERVGDWSRTLGASSVGLASRFI